MSTNHTSKAIKPLTASRQQAESRTCVFNTGSSILVVALRRGSFRQCDERWNENKNLRCGNVERTDTPIRSYCLKHLVTDAAELRYVGKRIPLQHGEVEELEDANEGGQ